MFGKQRAEVLFIDASHPGIKTRSFDVLITFTLIGTPFNINFILILVHLLMFMLQSSNPLGVCGFRFRRKKNRTWVNAEDRMHYMCSGYPSFEEHRPWTQIKAFRGLQLLLGYGKWSSLRYNMQNTKIYLGRNNMFNMHEYAHIWRCTKMVCEMWGLLISFNLFKVFVWVIDNGYLFHSLGHL